MLSVMVAAVAKLIVPLVQLAVAPVATLMVFKFSRPPLTFTLALVRRLVAPFRFIVAPVPMLSVADAAGAVDRLPPMLAVPGVVNVARLPLIEMVPTLFKNSPTSRLGAVTVPLERMFNVPVP